MAEVVEPDGRQLGAAVQGDEVAGDVVGVERLPVEHREKLAEKLCEEATAQLDQIEREADRAVQDITTWLDKQPSMPGDFLVEKQVGGVYMAGAPTIKYRPAAWRPSSAVLVRLILRRQSPFDMRVLQPSFATRLAK
ncbi:hypothetical protein [Nonomuraea sp. B19D2]|uniref:hypothetical protein n=1 Tax=Nonomuraea sp. B19D2 TaxID=3159561 RepID=UPI0032DAD791